MIFDNRPCVLGEGPFWHPERQQLFWFDIIGQKMLTGNSKMATAWEMPEMVSAAGWISRSALLIASESALLRFDIDALELSTIIPLESDNPATRSNDGRADPQGGFWIGTMGKTAAKGAGAIYRFYRGELRRLYANISIPNAICFPPDGKSAHFADTATACVMRVALDAQGWPVGEPSVFLDLQAEGLNPDGAVVDASGLMWLAQWGASRVAAYAPDGSFVRAVEFDAPHTSCPAFGDPHLTTLYCTSARQGLDDAALAAHPSSGMTFFQRNVAEGQPEHQVIL